MLSCPCNVNTPLCYSKGNAQVLHLFFFFFSFTTEFCFPVASFFLLCLRSLCPIDIHFNSPFFPVNPFYQLICSRVHHFFFLSFHFFLDMIVYCKKHSKPSQSMASMFWPLKSYLQSMMERLTHAPYEISSSDFKACFGRCPSFGWPIDCIANPLGATIGTTTASSHRMMKLNLSMLQGMGVKFHGIGLGFITGRKYWVVRFLVHKCIQVLKERLLQTRLSAQVTQVQLKDLTQRFHHC